MAVADDYLAARDALIAVRQLPGGQGLALRLYEGLSPDGSYAQLVGATREAQLLLKAHEPSQHREVEEKAFNPNEARDPRGRWTAVATALGVEIKPWEMGHVEPTWAQSQSIVEAAQQAHHDPYGQVSREVEQATLTTEHQGVMWHSTSSENRESILANGLEAGRSLGGKNTRVYLDTRLEPVQPRMDTGPRDQYEINVAGIPARPDPEVPGRWAISESDIEPRRIRLVGTTDPKGMPESPDQVVGARMDRFRAKYGDEQPALPDSWPARGLDWNKLWDALPDNTPVWLFHATDRENAELLMREGADPEAKPMSLGRMRYEAGEPDAVFAPGAGLGRGLTVAPHAYDVSGYGRVTLAVRVLKRDVAVSPEQANLGATEPVQALRVGDALVPVKIPPEAFVEIDPGGSDWVRDQLRAGATKALRFVEPPDPRIVKRLERLGVPWVLEEKRLGRWEVEPRDWHGRWTRSGSALGIGKPSNKPKPFPGLDDESAQKHMIAIYERDKERDVDAVWYEQAHRDIGFLAEKLNAEGIDITPQRLGTVVAAMASNVAWETSQHLLPNLENALKAVRFAHDHPGADPHQLARDFSLPDRPGLIGQVLESGLRAANGEDPDKFIHGYKLRSFYNNLTWPGETDSVAIDRHMIRAFLGEHDSQNKDLPTLTEPRYLWAAEQVRQAAAKLGISPDHLQAVVWSQWLREYKPIKKRGS